MDRFGQAGTSEPGATNGHSARGAAVAVLAPEASESSVGRLLEELRGRGLEAALHGIGPGVVLIADTTPADLSAAIDGHAAVERVLMPDTRYRLGRREVAPGGTVVEVGAVPFGGDGFVVIAGPCAVESKAQVDEAARLVADAGGAVLRGGAFKPRTSPYNFRGLGLPGVELLAQAGRAAGLPVVTEIMDHTLVEAMYPQVDAFQVGARNMQNFVLLRAMGELDKPVLLKRGPGATVEEWLLAAEHVLLGGNDQVILCERGIRAFGRETRYTLDLASVALVRHETHLPVIVDPSHATGDPALVGPMSLAALAAGADGVMVEMHPAPRSALSDGFQALTAPALAALVQRLEELAPHLGRHLVRSEAAIGERV